MNANRYELARCLVEHVEGKKRFQPRMKADENQAGAKKAFAPSMNGFSEIPCLA